MSAAADAPRRLERSVPRAGWMVVGRKEFGDHLLSARFTVLVVVLGLAAAIPLYFAAAAIRDIASSVTDSQAVFVALFWLAPDVSDGITLPSVVGFMAYVAAEPYAWRRLGPANQSTLLAPLRQLAARAPLTASEKADPSRVRDRADDDAPLLALVDDSDPVTLLDHALTRLVNRVGSLRA